MAESLDIKYAETLFKFAKIPVVIIAIIFFTILIIFAVTLKFKCTKDFAVYLVLGILILILIYFLVVYPIQIDINTNAYIKYTGNFFVEDYYYVNRSSSPYILIKLPHQEKSVKYRISGSFQNVAANTTYTGEFVYGENSRIIVDIQTQGNTGDGSAC